MPVTGLLAASSVAQGAAGLGSAYTQSNALRAQADYERQQAEINARLSEMQGEDALRRGDVEASKAIKEGKQVIGAQRAALAAQGIDINSGSAADIQEDTRALSEQDAATIRNNAWRSAWGFKTEALDIRGKAKMSSMAAENAARNTILTGGINAIGKFAEAGAYTAKGLASSKKQAKLDTSMPSASDLDMPEFGSGLKGKKNRYSVFGKPIY